MVKERYKEPLEEGWQKQNSRSYRKIFENVKVEIKELFYKIELFCFQICYN